MLQRRKERGRIAVESVHVVETASLGSNTATEVASNNDSSTGGVGGGVPPGLPFQIGYREAGQEYTLYLVAAREEDRAEWIQAIRAGEYCCNKKKLIFFFSSFMYIFFLNEKEKKLKKLIILNLTIKFFYFS